MSVRAVATLIGGTSYVPAGGASGAAVALTGSTSETTLATIAIPANSMGANGRLRITTFWSTSGVAGTKTARVRFGGTAFVAAGVTTTYWQNMAIIRNANNVAVQKSFATISTSSFDLANGTAGSGAINTAAAQNITLTGQLSNAGDTLTLEAYEVEILGAS